MWNLDPPPGFQGLRSDIPLASYTRHLPHWRQEGATYFVTFRLGDSIPQSKLDELVALREDWERRFPAPRSSASLEQLVRIIAERVERWLDEGMGSCVLKQPALAAFITQAMYYFDLSRYELGCYVVMPNHVHAIIRPLKGVQDPLEEILGSWKQYASKRINCALSMHGELWQEECFDRIVRDEEHLYRAIQYIGRNPEKAGLPLSACQRWIRPEWERLGWKFDEVP